MEVQLKKRENGNVFEREGKMMESSSPEAKLGMTVEDIWDNLEAQLSPTDKLNACFESIPVSSFPLAQASKVEIKSNCSLAEAVSILSQHKLLSAPVVDVEAADDATWIERYIGIVEFAGIAVWILHQSEDDESNRVLPSPKSNSSAAAVNTNGVNRVKKLERTMSPRSAAMTSGNFFGALTASELYKTTTVRDISGSFRWAPFLALQDTNSMLTVLLLLSKYKMKGVPVVGGAKVENIITQSAVIHMLAECAGLHWFENFGTRNLTEIGLPLMSPKEVVKVYEDEPVLQAFKLMRLKGVGGIPVVERDGAKAVGNISIRDVQFLLTAPEIYKDCRSITAKDFLLASKKYREEHHEGSSPPLSGMITCKKDDTLKKVILTLDSLNIHRIYVVDEGGCLEGVITLRDIISRLVHEPRNYFGDFFDGVIPMPANSRV
ncbi:SNF1-related protein kinase regulatory subunit gamma-1-like [Chenopodium quinoa]|uniref:SNF1-related protein kinase regulatory subunit gamma-1-like n=1 Tax=Chenopodium quinoa TaxID=63459 RepID=UPI000B77B3F9|nr:SNF1-related protein kinase regulatory subunit gamma-1-like [Chenopodium quinoa]